MTVYAKSILEINTAPLHPSHYAIELTFVEPN